MKSYYRTSHTIAPALDGFVQGKECTNGNRIAFVLLVISTILLIITSGCGTSKRYAIRSNPEGALIMQHDKADIEDSTWIEYRKTTPSEEKVRFYSEDAYFFSVEKRGYHIKTLPVSQDGDTAITFQLDRIEGVSEDIFNKNRLTSGKFYFLPPDIEVIIQSGLGRMDKKTPAVEQSKTVSEQFYEALVNTVDQNKNSQICPFIEPTVENDWANLSGDVRDFLLGLDIKRLDYYGQPPCITDKVQNFKTVLNAFPKATEDDNVFLLYLWGKCISETKGRKAGNIFLSILGPVAVTANPATVYDPEALASTTGTTIVLFVIDAKTSEVLHVVPQVFSHADITETEQLKRVAEKVSRFPRGDEEDENQ